ncbi:MAG: hypothetical protein ACT4O9_04980 [Blastocatellia bacterium]
MARKKRRLEPVVVPEKDSKAKPRYQDPFQQTVGRSIEEAGKKFEGQGRNILYGLGALAALGVIVWVFMAWSGRSNEEAQTALGKAIETSQAQITETPPPAGSTQKTFKTEKERAEAAIAEFTAVTEKHGGAVGEKAKYLAAVTRISIDRPVAVQELEGLSKSGSDVGKLAKFALAQTKAGDGKYDEAVALYQELLGMNDPIVAKDTISFELAGLYEKQGKKQEAVDTLFGIVKTASEAKDLDGKAVPLSSTAMSAKDKLTELDPEKAKEIPEQAPDPSGGGMPFGL